MSSIPLSRPCATTSSKPSALVEEAVKTKLILDSVDAWLLSQPSLIAKRTRGVLPAVRDRQALVSTLRGLLGDLGRRQPAEALSAPLFELFAQQAVSLIARAENSYCDRLRQRKSFDSRTSSRRRSSSRFTRRRRLRFSFE